jgi:hypothetical protein
MQGLYWTVSIVLVVVLLAIAGQQYRYLRWRRDVAADQQVLLHSSSVFHVATLVALSPGQKLLAGVRDLVDASEDAGGSVVYAGKMVVNALKSRQISGVEWDAFVLAQYDSREAYAAAESNPALQKARASFVETYALGMQRSALLNLAVPVMLLGKRTLDIITRRPARYPFTQSEAGGQHPAMSLARRDMIVNELLNDREFGKDACVVLNFIKEGSKEEREANASYGGEMMGLMAEMGMGPVHMGKAVTLEGNAMFDGVVIVYYPGVEFFAEMIQSSFFGGISGNKQLGDTLSSPTVPLLPHL